MKDEDNLYQKIVSKRETIRKEMEELEELEQIYAMKRMEKYAECNHIWVVSDIERDSYEGRTYKYSGCIKCGLEEIVMEKSFYHSNNMNFEQRIMFDYMSNNQYKNGLSSSVYCDLPCAQSIYQKIKQDHPAIEDELALKYFKIALEDMRHKKVNDQRKEESAKKLSLH